jgi:general stress protein YciG
MTLNKKDILREALSEIGRKGGKASAKSLTAEQRTARARKAGKAGGRGRASYVVPGGGIEPPQSFRPCGF